MHFVEQQKGATKESGGPSHRQKWARNAKPQLCGRPSMISWPEMKTSSSLKNLSLPALRTSGRT